VNGDDLEGLHHQKEKTRFVLLGKGVSEIYAESSLLQNSFWFI
jgi:hypothetical protein